MAKSKNKNGKVQTVKNGKDIDAVNLELADMLSSTLDLEGEMQFFLESVRMLNAGEISARGLQATILESEKIGSAPTIKPSHYREFITASKIRALKGGENFTLRELFNIAIQGRKSFKGTKFAEKISSAESAESLKSAIPSQGERAKKRAAHHNNKVEKVATIEDIIKQLGKALQKDKAYRLNAQGVKDAQTVAFLLAQMLERSKLNRAA